MSALDLIKTREARLVTALSPHHCAERLSAAIDGYFVLFGQKPVIGEAQPTGATLKKRINYRNSFQTIARLTFYQEGGGTRIAVRSGMPIVAMIFMTVWFGFVAIFLVGALATTATAGFRPDDLMFILVPAFMFVFGIGLIFYGAWLARDEHAFLTSFVAETLEGRVQPTVPGPTQARRGDPLIS